MGTILTAISFITSPVGRWVGVIALIGMAFLAGDIRGRRIEHTKCEDRARAAADAAVAQDRSAQKELDASNATTLEELSKQKETSDARVRELEKTMADGIVQCVYGADGKPDLGGVRKQSGKGAGDPPAARPARVPSPRPRPAGDKG
jgi:hypothetical protein